MNLVRGLASLIFLLGLCWTMAQATEGIREVVVRFAPDATRSTLQGRIQGRASVDYVLQAKAGQTLTATLAARIDREGDINASPTGGTRQLQYRLRRGEASWQLRLDRMVEY